MLWIGVALLGAGGFASAGEAPAPPTKTQVQAWIKQLGHEDFQQRAAAREKLLRAGKAVLPALKAAQDSTDLEVKTAIASLLLQLKWFEIRSQVNYLELFPARTAFAVSIPDAGGAAAKARQTALGRLLDGEDFKPLRDQIAQTLKNAPMAQMGLMEKLLVKWSQRFGKLGAGVWAFNPRDPSKMGMAAIAELPAGNTEAVFNELLKDFHVTGTFEQDTHRGLPLWIGPRGMGAIALAGRHVVLAPNVNALMQIAEGLIKSAPENLARSPAFQKIKPHLGEHPDFTLVFNFSAYMKMLSGMMAGMPMGGGGMGGLLEKAYGGFDLIALSTHIRKDLFEDRFIVALNEKPSAMRKMMDAAWKGTTPLKEALAVAPADAVFLANQYVEGGPLWAWGLEYVKAMMQIQGRMMAAMGLPAPNPEKAIKKLETATGLQFADLASAIKGDMVYWATLAKELAPPELGLSIGCESPEKASALAAQLAQLANGLSKLSTKKEAPAVEKATQGGHTIYTESEDSPWLQDPKRKTMPYRLSWAASGKRLILASSAKAIQQRLAALAVQTPGFDPSKILPPGAPGQPVAKACLVLDLPKLLNYGAKFGLPLLGAQLKGAPEWQKIVLDLSKKPDLFKGLPAMSLAGFPPKDGVQVSVVRGPLGVVPTYALAVGAVVGGIVLSKSQAMRAAVRVAPGAAPVPPPAVRVVPQPAAAPGGGKKQTAKKKVAAGKKTWTCAMHPRIHMAKSGKCPICNMDLIPGVTEKKEGGKRGK